jgi:peptidoglycan/xylan/chitin deacetylase (PgdA/CDA1 family)
MKDATRAIAALIEIAARPFAWTRLARPKGLIVLGYHRIDDSGGHLSVSGDHFRAHLDWIEAAGLPVVGLSSSTLPPGSDTPRVAITFDDGYLSVAELAWPELRSRGWPATVYLVADYLDGARAFPWDEVMDDRARLMDKKVAADLAADGMTIGSHSSTHRYLPALSHDEAWREVHDSRHTLEDVIGHPVMTFSYPMGGWNGTLRDMVDEAGYTTAVTCQRGRNISGRDLLALRRPIVESDPIDFVRIIKGYYDFLRPFDWWRERRRQKKGREPSLP